MVDSLAYTIKGLRPGALYRFRVRAENVHGRSEPSTPSEEVRISLGSAISPTQSTVQPENIYIKPGGDFKTRFILQEELGKGRFGVVHKVVERDTGHTLAAKIVKCIKAKDKAKVFDFYIKNLIYILIILFLKFKIQEEISIMQSLKHPKLLQLAAAFESQREIVMVMEL